MSRHIRFEGGPADGRQLEVPDISIRRRIHVKAFEDGVVLYIQAREGTVDYDWSDSDGETVTYAPAPVDG